MRIFITGPSGSGKSTLAQEIGRKLNIACYSLDEIHWKREVGESLRRPIDEKLVLLERITKTSNWIIEGVQFKWADLAIENSDIIIVQDIGIFLNHYLIIKRFFRQLCGIESSSYKPTIKILIQFFKWSSDYRETERKMLLNKISFYSKKIHFFKSLRKAKSFIKDLY